MSWNPRASKSRYRLGVMRAGLIAVGLSGCAPQPPVVQVRPVAVDPVPVHLLAAPTKTACLPKGDQLQVTQLEKAYSCKDAAETRVIAHLATLQSAVTEREKAQLALAAPTVNGEAGPNATVAARR